MDEYQQRQAGILIENWQMFSTPEEEIKQMFISLGKVIIESDTIYLIDYPFKSHRKVPCKDIINIDITAAPPTIRVGNELLFISATEKGRLTEFAQANHLPLVDRADIWDWLLVPFLDTEYSDEMHQRLNNLLSKYGLNKEKVAEIRQEVNPQMFKYNFDTMLWEWVHLGALDVLGAMRAKYTPGDFADFYRRVMDIALLADKIPGDTPESL